MRLPVLSSDEMTAEQRDLYREILGGPRGQGPRAVQLSTGAGGLAGPFNAMLYAPPVGHALQELGVAIRFRTQLSPRIREMAILVVAQAWDSAYERGSHEPIGREAGLTDAEIEALRTGADPGFADKEEQVAYSVARALTGPDADLDDQAYDTAAAVLGERALVELSALAGYYATLAMQLRIFRVDIRQKLDSSGTWEWEPVPELSSPLWDSRSRYQIRSDQSSTDMWSGRIWSATLFPWPNLGRLILICRSPHISSSRASSPSGSRPGNGVAARSRRSRHCSRTTAWAGTRSCTRCACSATAA